MLTLEVIQASNMKDDSQILVSKAMFIDLPGAEVLVQDPETLRIKQGSTLNQGILGWQSVVNDISTGRVSPSYIPPSKMLPSTKPPNSPNSAKKPWEGIRRG